MKKTRFVCLFLAFVLLQSCSDTIEEFITYEKVSPIIISLEAFRAQTPLVEPSHTLRKTGKIYVYNQYLFVNERGKGIHIIDNSNPNAPRPLSFLNILGNIDMAVRNNVLYADCVVDLVRFDVSNPAQPLFLSRQENVLPNPYNYYTDTDKIVVGENRETVREKTTRSGGGNSRWRFEMFSEASSFSASPTASTSPNSTGKGGSMARFAIVQDYLYAVSNSLVTTFHIAQPTAQKVNTLNLFGGLETIFPYEGKLFLGTLNGMYILSLSNPAQPTQLSFVGHFPSCDPVVVEGNYAYVTLRMGNTCQNALNQLEVYDISNPISPQKISTFPMHHPHGLGIQNNKLFICEGIYGLKAFDATNKTNIDNNLKDHLKDLHAYDVIPLGNTLILVGKGGLYQYDITNINKLKLLSFMEVQE